MVDAAYVARAHKLGLPVRVWTVDEETDMRRMIDLGVDAIITDVPDRLVALLTDNPDRHRTSRSSHPQMRTGGI